MTDRYAVIDAAGIVINIVLWDGLSEWAPGESLSAVASESAQIGWIYRDDTFTDPNANDQIVQPA